MTSQARDFADRSSEIPEHILTALRVLAPEQRQQAFAFIEFLYQTQQATLQLQTTPKQQRVFGQYAGKISMSDDFDEPLPDAFWLGET
ncbi:DUF2281 domain-containing protein [Cyanobacteria bacterium FACHB-DQ100]|nr:DUF2281 domain-containing protein [Cyanobacteria bacterium FACHB-DQ100]